MELDHYESFENTSENDEPVEPAQKRQRTKQNWIFDRTFDSPEDALTFLKAEIVWSYKYKNSSFAGVIVTYRCNKMKFRGKQCPALIYLLYDANDKSKVHLFRNDCEHSHDSDNAVYEMDPELAATIQQLFNMRLKPKAILYNLITKGLVPPPKAKFDTFLKKLHVQRYGEEKIHLGTLEKWLKDNKVVPENDTEPFIVNYKIDDKNPTDIKFRFFVSTKKLLSHAINARKMHADATYKLIWQGFPVFLVGMTDMRRKFHPFGIGVATNETIDDFEFMFKSIKDIVFELFGTAPNPNALISDAATSIRNGFEKVFGQNKTIIMCWAHMRRAVVKKLPEYLKDKRKQNSFLADVDQLQLSKSPEIFSNSSKLFLKKWRSSSKDLVDYFEQIWLVQHPNWYEGVLKLTPSTNNALESKNKLIKDEHTLRERLDIGNFRTVLYEMLTQWSIEYHTNLNAIHDTVHIDLQMETKGYNFAKLNLKINAKRCGNTIMYRIPASIDHQLQSIDDSTNWPSFDVFKKNSFAFFDCYFPFPLNSENWKLATCDCSDFFKLFMCEHVVGIAIRMKMYTVSPEAKNVPIGQKRKRGRPAKAKKALVVQ